MADETYTYIQRDIDRTVETPYEQNKTNNINTKHKTINIIFSAHDRIEKCL